MLVSDLTSLAEVGIGINLAYALIRDLRTALLRRKQEYVASEVQKMKVRLEEATLQFDIPFDVNGMLKTLNDLAEGYACRSAAVATVTAWIAAVAAFPLAGTLWFAACSSGATAPTGCAHAVACLAFLPLLGAIGIQAGLYWWSDRQLEDERKCLDTTLAKIKVKATPPLDSIEPVPEPTAE